MNYQEAWKHVSKMVKNNHLEFEILARIFDVKTFDGLVRKFVTE